MNTTNNFNANCEKPKLIRETGGIIPGSIYICLKNRACMVWSPHWKCREPLGWSTYACVTPFFRNPEDLGEININATPDDVKNALICLGIL